MKRTKNNRKETLIVILVALIIIASFNALMVYEAPSVWTNAKAGSWNAFWNRFEFSGFDSYTYIIISTWRPLYVLARHPLLAVMMWPLSQLNDALKDSFGINCAIYIVAVLWTIISTCSWVLVFKILRQIQELTFKASLVLTFFFFGLSHVMLTTFLPDHFTLTLPILLLTYYLAGKAIKAKRPMPLWQSLPLAFIGTGVTTTNIVKVGFADLFTRRFSILGIIRHFLWYLIPLSILFGIYMVQERTTQAKEVRNNNMHMEKKAAKDSTFAKYWESEKIRKEKAHADQIIDMPGVTSTDYEIDRLASVYENIFGEGLILHKDYLLRDANKKDHRPGIVRYDRWYYYIIEGMIVLLMLFGIWCGRHNRLLQALTIIFLFDMVLHVGLNFASADVYIMTTHWAFIIPFAISCIYRSLHRQPKELSAIVTIMVLSLTAFLWWHNVSLLLTKFAII